MINFTNRTTYYISSCPTDMRKGREGLAQIVREVMVSGYFRPYLNDIYSSDICFEN